MGQLLIWISISVLLFVFFLIFIILGVKKKNKRSVFISIFFLLLTLITCFWVLYLFLTKSYNKVAEVFRPRSGIEIYSSQFGKPTENCVSVINKMDQIVPRLDCCIWLEFKTCPKELNRIILQEPYKMKKYLSLDTTLYIPNYSPKPLWWTPHILGDSIFVMRKYNPENPNRDKVLIFSKDSSHVFYYDMAD